MHEHTHFLHLLACTSTHTKIKAGKKSSFREIKTISQLQKHSLNYETDRNIYFARSMCNVQRSDVIEA